MTVTVLEALRAFDLSNRADDLSAKTVTNYDYLLLSGHHSLSSWLRSSCPALALEALTAADLRGYIVWLKARRNEHNGRPLSAQTVQNHIRALHRFCSWAALEYELRNPAANIRYPKREQRRKPKAVELKHLRAMFAACGDDLKGQRDRAIMAFMIDTGCRAAGVCGLLVDDIDLIGHKAVVTEKGRKTRRVVFTTKTALLLAAWCRVREPAPALFYNTRTREPLTVSGLRVILRKIADGAGVKGRVNPHAFRHAFAREYVRSGGDLVTLSLLLGHSQQSTTTEYYALFTPDEAGQRHALYSPMKNLFEGVL